MTKEQILDELIRISQLPESVGRTLQVMELELNNPKMFKEVLDAINHEITKRNFESPFSDQGISLPL